jgi:hypothetical protein
MHRYKKSMICKASGGVRTAIWLETSRRWVTRLGDHAIVLNQDGIDFAAMESEDAQKLRALTRPFVGADGSARV